MKILSRSLFATVFALAASSAYADITVVKTVRVEPPANIFVTMRDFDQAKLTSFKTPVELVYAPIDRFSVMEQKFVYPNK